ncbi:MAG: electron transport complex subunit RsxC [Bacteroidales bacterium]|nr:electron transport complex subunit RsxC [Bacteroidales bacterium]
MITFKIGGIHPHDNKIAKNAAIESLKLPNKVAISMAQHLGAPATPIVTKGDSVVVGQVIGEPSGFISGFVHSSVSGTVVAVEPRADIVGNMVTHVVIDVEGDIWDESIDRSEGLNSNIVASQDAILAKIKSSGIVGMGGATFPTHVKLCPPKDKKADFLLINGAECEPYVTADDRLMREKSACIAVGTAIMAKVLGGCKSYICIEENKPEAIAAMTAACSKYENIEVLKLKKKYPQGGEKQLIDAVTKHQVPSGALPIEAGCVVQNVATAFAAYEAVQKNKPLIERVMTVTGQCVAEQKNYLVRFGTPLSYILETSGCNLENAAKIISGGPMMGKAVANIEATTQKGSSCLLMLTKEQTARMPIGNCIRCGKCADACPMGLEPWLLYKLSENGNQFDALEDNKIFDCIECGCCTFTCPSFIPLLDIIRVNKVEVMKIIRNRAKK